MSLIVPGDPFISKFRANYLEPWALRKKLKRQEVLEIECYGLNISPKHNSYIEVLNPIVTIFGDGVYRRIR